jgi:RimJ/RimL family protein N-acetyltransferase
MTARIRDFTDDDVDWAVGFLHGWDPGLPPEAWRRIVTGEAAPLRRLIVAEVGGDRIGFGGVNDPEGLPYPLITVLVATGHRGRGIGTTMYAELLPLVDQADAGSGMPDHDEHSLAIARHWGFEVLGHGIDSVLDLDVRPPDPVLPDGVEVRIVAGADVVASGLDVDGFLDQVGDFPEVEIYGSRITNGILLQMAPDLVWVLIVDPDGVLAGSSLMPTGEGPWFIGFTGSAPRARGRGLARSAKQAAHRYAFDSGARAIRTTNEERNGRMRALNASMGYTKVSGDLRLIRRVNSR